VGMNPVATPAQTTAVDITCTAATGINITWNPVSNWGDGGTNASNRRYRLYYSRNGFTNIIKSGSASTSSFTYKPVDRGAYIYRIVAVNGCGKTTAYADSAAAADLNSCAPSCTMLMENNFDSSNNFAETCGGGADLWNLTAGVGNGGTTAWLCNLTASSNQTSSLEMSSPANLIWLEDVKLRFWSSCNLASDDAGVVEIFTNDTGLWRKIILLPYPSLTADVPSSIEYNCQSGTLSGNQPAFQGIANGTFYDARLDDYLTPSTTQIKIRFRAASGLTSGDSTWVIDDVKLGYGITDSIYFWSFDGNPEIGVIKDGSEGYGNNAIFRWEDGGIYHTSEFRIYRAETITSGNIREESSAVLIHQQTDNDSPYYEWTDTADPSSAVNRVFYYKIYGYKEPCGESDLEEN
ncbi:MAG: hypothetical protein N2445_07755, partial [Acidobacteria bacterium]|nr:hypothetical protein [Acidobacteriota bacterium]